MGTTRRCEAVKADGEQCGAWARRDSNPPTCALHSLSPEDRAHKEEADFEKKMAWSE